MLTNLHVKNIALIEDVDVEFSPGLNILTGETGAGKSIILGSVNLALGKKMTSDSIGQFGKSALVELIFEVENDKIIKFLQEQEIELQGQQVIITRKLMEGRSICKINGETCTMSQMKAASSLLIDIHGQHEHQKLLSTDNQLEILDEFGGAEIVAKKELVKVGHREYQELESQLSQYNLDQELRMREISFLEFEIDEIEKAQLQDNEDVQLEKQHLLLANSKKIIEVLQDVYRQTGNDQGDQAGELIGGAIRSINGVVGFDDSVDNLHAMLLDIESMLNDFNRELAVEIGKMSYSEETFAQLDERLNLINNLKAKYGSTIEKIQLYQYSRQQKLEQLQNYEIQKQQLMQRFALKQTELSQLSDQLTAERKRVATIFTQQLSESLRDLNFADIDFDISFKKQAKFSKNGNDAIEFLISTNPGETKKPLNKVVSGGELSRIMLAVKTLMADKEDTETQIFDEIDVGISGRTAQLVSEKMALIGSRRQVICITHLPQIAAMADSHFEIKKTVNENITTTGIEKLTQEQSIAEIARILGGTKITERTMDTAQEMKELAQSHKKNESNSR